MTYELQIEELNERVKLRVAPSKIHGVGVFAIRDIKQSERLYANEFPRRFTLPYEHFDKLNPDAGQLLLERWPSIVYGSLFMYPDCNMQAYMNHAESSNYDNVNDTAKCNIKTGEEVTEDYRTILGYGEVFSWLK